MSILNKVFGNYNEKELKKIWPIVKEVNAFEDEMHPLTDEQLRAMTDEFRERLEDGETLDLGGLTLEFVHAPGHTVGSLAIYAREPRVLFTGDNVLGNVTPSISPDHGDMALYFQTLHRFLDFDMALICPGHGPMVQDARQWVEKVIQHRLEREEQVLSALRRGHGTVEEMFREIYPVLDSRLHSRAQGQIRCHLIKLEREGRVRANDGSYALTQAG